MVWYSHLFQKVPKFIVIHTVKGFGIVNKAEIDVFLELSCILKSRDITLPRNFHLVKAMVFPVVLYGCERWTIKKLSTEELMLLSSGVGEDS